MALAKLREERGQAAVEMAVLMPVVLAIAVIAVNALLFFSDCAAFDRVARQAVVTYATSPAYGQGTEQSRAMVADAIGEQIARDNISSDVAVEGDVLGHLRFTATLHYQPTLFGLGLKSSVFGVNLPDLTHATSMTIDAYKPGVIL